MEAISVAILKITFLALFGFFLYKKNFLEDKTLDFLSAFVINFSVPFLAFAHILENLKSNPNFNVVNFLFLSLVIFLLGVLFGLIFSANVTHEFKREFISLLSFQNSGYLPLNLVVYIFADTYLKEQFIIFIFLYILGFDMIMWSFGSYFIFRSQTKKFNFKSIITPPVVATVFALVLVYTDTAKFFPKLILDPVKMIGQTSFVLSMLILGGWLAKMSVEKFYKNISFVLKAAFLKLIIMPAVFLIFLVNFKVFSLFGFFIIMQAAMPSAVSLPIVVKVRSGHTEFVSGGVLLSHIFSILTVPFWLSLYLKISGLKF